MSVATPGKRKLLNNSPSSSKSSKRSSQTISGIMNSNNALTTNSSQESQNQGTSSMTRSSKRNDLQMNSPANTKEPSKRVNSYTKNHIKNNIEFMQKSHTKTINTNSPSKFLSGKLRNNSNFINSNNAAINNNSSTCNKTIKSTKGLTSQKIKKNQINEQSLEMSSEANIQMHSYSKENLKEQDDLYRKRLEEFQYQLEKLKQLNKSDMLAIDPDMIIQKIEANLFDAETNIKANELEFPYFTKLIKQINDLKQDCENNMSVVENWYATQKSEVTAQYNMELARATQEFQDKRRELKDGLRNDNEDKKRQIEIDRNQLDINMDITDAKPKVTRKLRRRNNATGNSNGTDYNIDSTNSCLDSTSAHHLSNVVSTTSSLLASNNAITNAHTLAHSNLPTCLVSTVGSVSSQFTTSNLIQTGSYFTSSVTNILPNSINPTATSINERKKAKLAAITFTLSEEDINEDLKQLC